MRRASVLLLALSLLLSGCTSMLEVDHLSASPHVNQTVIADDPSVLRAENYQGLVNGVLYFVSQGMDSGTIRLTKYSGDPELDLAAACAEVQEEDPLGAYALADIEYTYSLIVSYYECSFTLSYRRTEEQLDALHTASGSGAIREELAKAMEARQPELALRISSYYAQEETLRSLLEEAWNSVGADASVLPQAKMTFYPQLGGGSQRIVELNFSYSQPVPKPTPEADAGPTSAPTV